MNFLFGLLGYVIQGLRKRILFEIPLDSLESVQRIKIVRNDMSLELVPKGEEALKVALSKTIDDWIGDIKEQAKLG